MDRSVEIGDFIMPVGSVNTNNVAFGQQPVKKSNAKRTAAYVAAGVGTAAAITGAVIYRKNLANLLGSLKEMFTPLKTKMAHTTADLGSTVRDKARAGAEAVKEKVGEGVDALKDQAAKLKEEATEAINNSETAKTIKNETTSFFKNAKEFIKDGAAKAWGYAKQAFNWVKEKAVNLFEHVKEFFKGVKKEAVDTAAKAE